MVDLQFMVKPIMTIYTTIMQMRVLVYGYSFSIGDLFLWASLGSVFLHYYRKWIDG